MGRTKQTPRTGKKSKAYRKQQQQKKEQEEAQSGENVSMDSSLDKAEEQSGVPEPSKDSQLEPESCAADVDKSSDVDKNSDTSPSKTAGTKRKMQAPDSSTGGDSSAPQSDDPDKPGAEAGDSKKPKVSDEKDGELQQEEAKTDCSKPVEQVTSSTEESGETGSGGEGKEDDEGPEDVSLAEGREMAEAKMKDESLQAQRSE